MEKERLNSMVNRCIFCGEQLVEGVCPNQVQHIKPMCLNCVYSEEKGDSCYCVNEENKLDAIQKIKASFDGGYEITGIELQPLPLKEPSRKCKRHTLNIDRIVNSFNAI